jgi:hypothetical protein
MFAQAKFKDTTFELAKFGDAVNFSGVRASEEDLNLVGAKVKEKLLTNIWPKGWGEIPEENGLASVVWIPEGREEEFIAHQKKMRMKHIFDKDDHGGTTTGHV